MEPYAIFFDGSEGADISEGEGEGDKAAVEALKKKRL